jgi:hypothetical protein
MTGLTAFLDDFRTKWQDYQRSIADWRDLQACDPDLVAAMASDLNLSVRDFERIVANGAGSDRLMEGMMAAFQLDGAELRKEAPATLRDAELTCARCSARKRCARELAAGTAAVNAKHFCPNADLFAMLEHNAFIGSADSM